MNKKYVAKIIGIIALIAAIILAFFGGRLVRDNKSKSESDTGEIVKKTQSDEDSVVRLTVRNNANKANTDSLRNTIHVYDASNDKEFENRVQIAKGTKIKVKIENFASDIHVNIKNGNSTVKDEDIKAITKAEDAKTVEFTATGAITITTNLVGETGEDTSDADNTTDVGYYTNAVDVEGIQSRPSGIDERTNTGDSLKKERNGDSGNSGNNGNSSSDNGNTNQSGKDKDTKQDDKPDNKTDDKQKPSSDRLDYPADLALSTVKISNEINSLNELGFAIDDHIYDISINNQPSEMTYFKLSDSFAAKVKADPMNYVRRSLQMSLLGHNAYESYDLSKLESENKMGFKASIKKDFATQLPADEQMLSVVSYDRYKNSISKGDKSTLKLSDTPLYNSGKKYLKVNNSEELIYALQNDYIPYAKKGTSAYKFMVQALDILSEITTSDMTETEKYKAIYEYVVENNKYAFATAQDDTIQTYKNTAFFLEGSMGNDVAVCDGLTKEIVLLTRLAGIESYHVGARLGNTAHAYVYVKVDGTYYLSCPTNGIDRYYDKSGKWQQYSRASYMLTDFDTNSSTWKYDSDSYPEIKAALKQVESYDFWSNTFVTINGKKYSYHVTNVDDALTILRDVSKTQREVGKTMEVELSGSTAVLNEAANKIKSENSNALNLYGGSFNDQALQVFVFTGSN